MNDKVEAVVERALSAIENAHTTAALEEARVRLLGRKGELTTLLRQMKSVDPEDRPKFGALVNSARETIEKELDERARVLVAAEKAARLELERIDVTMPGRAPRIGKIHPLTRGIMDITEIFVEMGFAVVEGPEVETDYYNFEALNTPQYHPARDVQDTFYVNDTVLLRTQTSPMQVREMEKREPPVKVVVPGRVYRRDQVDATHSPVFHQIEGLLVDHDITFTDLKGTLAMFARKFYGEERKVRFRPHYFPFTEPSAEMDISCAICGGAGCRVCKQEGWIEVLGCGLVHPNVLRAVGYDPDELTGYAFGMGVERLVMLKHGIDDLRLLYENDLRFLSQF
ncbi:MAG TPA: phenylalanine--tRNA ligase subunit alpha [Bacillota bacterium]|nr:phenylalanine--tRNA ligase subunit alpha [Bacillota bacterium]HOB42807.1 phenylalanine--tRNA ligase subunit alpha [Bacillota bacterium]HPQ03339.1 phenylalanine--tRNA ligase subunit alpha [Bacillota bacterium]